MDYVTFLLDISLLQIGIYLTSRLLGMDGVEAPCSESACARDYTIA